MRRKRAWMLLLVQLVSVFGGMLLATVVLYQGSSDGVCNMFYCLFDIMPLLFLLIIALPPMLVHGIWKDFLRVFLFGKDDRQFSICEIKKTLLALELLQKQVIYGTIMIVCIRMMYFLMNFTDISAIGPNMTVNISSLLYMVIALLFIEPLKVYAQRYLEDYLMEEEG